jgi:hypothetical protein
VTHARAGRRGRGLHLIAVVAALLAGWAVLEPAGRAAEAHATLAVEATPVPLDPVDPSRERLGPLEYRGGLWLRADDPRFGGFSDLRVSADGSELVAVSDCGSGFTARLLYDAAGRLAGLDQARLVALTDESGKPLSGSEIDAESLVAASDGRLEVGFEGRGRVEVYGPGFQGPPQPVGTPGDLGECGRNGGLELMADTGADRRLLVCETRRGMSRSVPAWTGSGTRWQERRFPLEFDGGWAGEPFRPTAAARLPDGDLLVLERRFPPLAVRLSRLDRTTLEGQGDLARHELARLEPPLTVDNFEGVEVREDDRGRTLVYLLSDDNDCAKTAGATRRGVQRTLLLLFVLAG